MLMSANCHGSLGAKHFGANIIAIERVAAHFHVAQRATGEAQIHHGVIDIADVLKLLAYQQRSLR